MSARVAALVLAGPWITGLADAQPIAPTVTAPPAEPTDAAPGAAAATHARPAHRFNLRAGFASSDTVDRPTICLEVVAVSAVSAEACGTGSGILHDQVGRQLAHFRLNVAVAQRAVQGGWASLRAGAGFAELEVGEDRPGFDFGAPDQPGSTAGPDGAVSLQWMRTIGGGVELVGTGTIGMAWFSGADRLLQPQDALQPYASLELGVGW